jgi:hypothetical protein
VSIKYYALAKGEEPPEEFCAIRHENGEPCDYHFYVPERTTTRNGKYKTKYGRRVPLCECCGYAIGDPRYNYCPNCGARIEVDA